MTELPFVDAAGRDPPAQLQQRPFDVDLSVLLRRHRDSEPIAPLAQSTSVTSGCDRWRPRSVGHRASGAGLAVVLRAAAGVGFHPESVASSPTYCAAE